MAPPRSSNSKSHSKDSKKEKKKPTQSSRRAAQNSSSKAPTAPPQPDDEIDLSATIPLTLQQLLLNVFKTGLLSADGLGWSQEHADPAAGVSGGDVSSSVEPSSQDRLDIKSLIQTIKSHLYNRDFDSAFTDAGDDLLCAYALRWSASRALGYAGIFKALLERLLTEMDAAPSTYSSSCTPSTRHVVCIGGGAGAEIVALAAVWRDLMDGRRISSSSSSSVQHESPNPNQDENTLSNSLAGMSLEPNPKAQAQAPNLAITAVDIADWSRVVDRLACAIRSPRVPGGRTHPAPLLQGPVEGAADAAGKTETKQQGIDFAVRFRRSDVLSIADEELERLFSFGGASTTAVVTLMFTLNELFSTSMAKTTAFLLSVTELLRPGAMLLVVDSPGSYSTLKLGKSKAQAGEGGETDEGAAPVQERRYPMKFLLDHTLLSVATGKWERVLSQDSRWWRRDAARLGYDVGEGAGLEDMRFQVHIYRRLKG